MPQYWASLDAGVSREIAPALAQLFGRQSPHVIPIASMYEALPDRLTRPFNPAKAGNGMLQICNGPDNSKLPSHT